MKKLLSHILVLSVFITSCKDDDIAIFDKPSAQRSAEAIATLKADLVAPQNGWKVKYRPVDDTGSYYVLLYFNDNGKVTIKTDLGANNGEFQEQTIGYRIDNALGLELIFENYSFFSFLFEQDQANFGAEFEFKFVNKTDDKLIFSSKTDLVDPTILTFEPASSSDDNLLGTAIASNLSLMSNDLERFSSSQKITYQNKDIILYASLDEFRRVLDINAVSKKTNPAQRQLLNESGTYYLEGNSIVLEDPISTIAFGGVINVPRISLTTFGETTLTTCADPLTVHTYAGKIGNDDVVIETTMEDQAGSAFATLSDFYFAPLSNIRRDRFSLVDEITANVKGAVEMHLYYGIPLNDGTTLYGIGFVIVNDDGSVTFALRKFNPVLTQNKIEFNFEPTITLFGSQETDANLDNINIYLDALAEGNTTYVFKYADDIYEFHNPCSGWSVVFVNGNA
jgi:hypothetical protein